MQGSKVPQAGPEPRAGAAQRTEHGEDPPFDPRGGGSPSCHGGIGGADKVPPIGDQSTAGMCMVWCRWRGPISKSCEWVTRGDDSPFGRVQRQCVDGIQSTQG